MQQEDPKSIWLANGAEVLVSPVDWEQFGHLKWHSSGGPCPYAKRKVRVKGVRNKWRVIYLHRAILNAPAGLVVNHRNGDTLDCQRHNLHLATGRANSTSLRVRKGVSKYHGVNFKGGLAVEIPGKRTVQSRIVVNGKRFYLGTFETEVQAARAYDYAALDAFGVAACTNFPLSEYLCALPELPTPRSNQRAMEDVPW